MKLESLLNRFYVDITKFRNTRFLSKWRVHEIDEFLKNDSMIDSIYFNILWYFLKKDWQNDIGITNLYLNITEFYNAHFYQNVRFMKMSIPSKWRVSEIGATLLLCVAQWANAVCSWYFIASKQNLFCSMDNNAIINKEQSLIAHVERSSTCPIGREGQPSCLFKSEIEKIKKILSTLLSQSPDAPLLKKLSTIFNDATQLRRNDIRSLLPTILRAIEESPQKYSSLTKDLEFLETTIVVSAKIRTNISIGEWLDTRIISAILSQFEYNAAQSSIAPEQSSIAPYRFGGCFRYDDFEVYDEKSINCPCLSPSPDVDHLKWEYIKQAPLTHFIFNTCSRISTGQHFVSMVIVIQGNEVALEYLDSQHVGPYHNGEIPPDFHTRDFHNPFCNRFKNYTSHFDDWFENLSIEANKDGYKTKLIHNMKTYQNNNYACGIYSLFHGVSRAYSAHYNRESKSLSGNSSGAGDHGKARGIGDSSAVDAAMDRFMETAAQMRWANEQLCCSYSLIFFEKSQWKPILAISMTIPCFYKSSWLI